MPTHTNDFVLRMTESSPREIDNLPEGYSQINHYGQFSRDAVFARNRIVMCTM